MWSCGSLPARRATGRAEGEPGSAVMIDHIFGPLRRRRTTTTTTFMKTAGGSQDTPSPERARPACEAIRTRARRILSSVSNVATDMSAPLTLPITHSSELTPVSSLSVGTASTINHKSRNCSDRRSCPPWAGAAVCVGSRIHHRGIVHRLGCQNEQQANGQPNGAATANARPPRRHARRTRPPGGHVVADRRRGEGYSRVGLDASTAT